MGISLGLVGLDSFGRAFADLFMSHPLVNRIALCDLEPERMAAFADRPSWKIKFDPRDAYTSLDDICANPAIDALGIITQLWLHAPQCIQAVEAGKHVYSAVPILSIPDGNEILDWCDKLIETCRRTGRHYMLGETTYYRPQAMYCRRRAREVEAFRAVSNRMMHHPAMHHPATSDFYGGHGGSHAYLVHEFVDAIVHERTPAIHAWEAVRYMAAGVMAHQSALRDGEVLDVPDWGDAPA